MIAPARRMHRKKSPPAWHAAFMAMMPAIRTHAKIAFRHLRAEARQEAVEEVICNSCAAFARLVELGKSDCAYPSVLAHYGVAQVRAGRRVGCRLNINDLASDYCQRRKNVTIDRLDTYNVDEDSWQEIVVEDRRAGPAETAATRIDVDVWFRRMRPRDRRIAKALAFGVRTRDVAKRFGISAGRVSQMRQEFYRNWEDFQSENDPNPDAGAAGD